MRSLPDPRPDTHRAMSAPREREAPPRTNNVAQAELQSSKSLRPASMKWLDYDELDDSALPQHPAPGKCIRMARIIILLRHYLPFRSFPAADGSDLHQSRPLGDLRVSLRQAGSNQCFSSRNQLPTNLMLHYEPASLCRKNLTSPALKNARLVAGAAR